MLERPELEQRLTHLQTQVERLWFQAETGVPNVEQRLAEMADQYAEYLKRWATTVERHTQAVTQLETYVSDWKDAGTLARQDAADRLQELQTAIEREWQAVKRMQEEPLRELRAQAESLAQVSTATASASQQALQRSAERFANFETEVHLRLNELTLELATVVAEVKTRLDRYLPSPTASAQWSLDDVTRLHGQLRGGSQRTNEFPPTIELGSTTRELPAADADHGPYPESVSPVGQRAARMEQDAAIPVRWAAAVVALGLGVVAAGLFGWRLQGQIEQANARALLAQQRAESAVSDAEQQNQAVRAQAARDTAAYREMALRATRVADVMAAPDLIRLNLSGANGASGYALFSRTRGLVVSGNGLPPLPTGGVLQAWLLTRTAAIKVGPLVAEPDGAATLAQPLPDVPPVPVVGVMVTSDPAGGANAPGPTLLSSVRVRPAAETQQP